MNKCEIYFYDKISKVQSILIKTRQFNVRVVTNALRKAANSVFCSFAKIGMIQLSKFEINLEIISSSAMAKILGNYKNINKTELRKIKTIINQIYMLKSRSITIFNFLC